MGQLEQMQADIGTLREAKGAHEAKLLSLGTQIEQLTTAVTDLTAVLNRGRGALWAICGASGAVGAIVAALIEYMTHAK